MEIDDEDRNAVEVLSKAFEAAFERWRNSDPRIRQYVMQRGHSLTGIHNMTFYFFMAGYESAMAKVDEMLRERRE